MNFQIMQHDGGRTFIPAIRKRTNQPLIYTDAKKAAAMCKRLTTISGIKYQPRPIAADAWRLREANRFLTGEYKPVIWVKEPWWKEIDGHFAHIGVKDKTRIAFTPDAEKGNADRQTAMLPGKYLQQFFGDVLNADQVRTFAMQHATQFEDNELKWAHTPEEIQAAYKPNLGCSCFSGTTKANLYGSGDFAVAYIEKDGKITARALCVPERKVYVRVYGDYDRLGKLLKAAGYRASEKGNDYTGLRLLKQWHWQGFYTDWYPNRSHEPCPKEPGKYLIVK